MADPGNSVALIGLNLTEEERDVLEGHRTPCLNLKSSLARLCTELFKFLFKWHTVCSCHIVCHWWEVYSLHVSILHWSILIQESPASAMSAFMILSCLLVHCHCSNVTSCCIVECCASLARALYLLSLLSKPRVEDILSSVVDRPRWQARCGCLDPSRPHGGTSKGQVLRSAFHFQKES